MSAPRKTAAFLAAALAACPAAAERHVAVAADPRTPPMQAAAPTHRVPLKVVILRPSGWALDEVQARVRKTVEIFAQCGVRLDASISEMTAPSGSGGVLYDRDAAAQPTSMAAVVTALAQPKPTLFYVEAFTDNSGQGGTSRNPLTSLGKPELDTAWVPFTNTQSGVDTQYLVDAHELGHVLANIGHWSPDEDLPPRRKGDPRPPGHDPGLMVGNPMIRTNVLAPYLCARVKAHPRAAGL